MGTDKIRYLIFVCGRWRWRPTKIMRSHGFRLVNFGPELTTSDRASAIALNDEWDRVRLGLAPASEEVFPPGTIGDGYQRAMQSRAAERAAKGIVWTKDQEKRTTGRAPGNGSSQYSVTRLRRKCNRSTF